MGHFYESYRNVISGYTDLFAPQYTTIKDVTYIAMVHHKDNKTNVTIYKAMDLTTHFYFELDYCITSYVFNKHKMIFVSDNKIEEYTRDTLVASYVCAEKIDRVRAIENRWIVNYKNRIVVLDENLIQIDQVELNFSKKFDNILCMGNNKILLHAGKKMFIYNYSKKKLVYTIVMDERIENVFTTVDRNIVLFVMGKEIVVYDIKQDKKVYSILEYVDDNMVYISQCYDKYVLISISDSLRIDVFDMESKKVVDSVDGLRCYFLSDDTIICFGPDDMTLYKLNSKGCFKLFKKRERITHPESMCRIKENILLWNDHTIQLINLFKDSRNDILFKKNFDKISASETSCLIQVNHQFIDIEYNKKQTKLFTRKTDWFYNYRDLILFGDDSNLYLVHKKSERVLIHVDNNLINQTKNRRINRTIQGGAISDTLLVYYTTTSIQVYHHNFIEFNLISNIANNAHKKGIRIFGDMILIQTRPNLLIYNKDLRIIFNRKCNAFDVVPGCLSVIDGSKVTNYAISGNTFTKAFDHDFGYKISAVSLIRQFDFITVFSKTNVFECYTINEINYNTTEIESETKIDQDNAPLETKKNEPEIQFLHYLNRNIQCSKQSKQLRKEAMELYKDILLYKSCISSEDTEYYIKGLSKEEVNRIIRMITEEGLELELVALVNRLLVYKGKWIEEGNLKILSNKYDI
ncbi:hypothetical protein ECANGB1_682 [Enterospora canceri]|uniref:Uncharacterized protein n=1 Tax=Enterospora canceri TaxID=1081671 RepID=A0A1Y1S7Q5_9MICR|nr:hypothetical protein ECANGB1_682 [Enterospora canceri]